MTVLLLMNLHTKPCSETEDGVYNFLAILLLMNLQMGFLASLLHMRV
jgi:hypothetical protein